jgi:hypothetical protein
VLLRICVDRSVWDSIAPITAPTNSFCRSGLATYVSLWVHAKRHYDLAGITAYWRARMYKELMNALGE